MELENIRFISHIYFFDIRGSNMKNIIKKLNKKTFKIDKKIINITLLILLLIIPMALSFNFRMQPASLPLMEQQAANNVMNYYKSQITNDIQSKYAYLPPEKQADLVNKQLALFLKQGKEQVKSQIKETSDYMKSRVQNKNGDTYLIAIDPWMQYKYTKNYIDNGAVGDTLINGKYVTTLRDGRNIHPDGPRFHPWLMAQFHKFLKIFNPDQSPMKSVFLFPAIWVTLAIIPAFFIGRKLSNNLGGFISATIIAVHQAIMSRTVAGFSDTDVHNVFFPLFILWFVIEAYFVKDIKKTTIYLSLASFFTAVYSLAWSGWWYTFDFIFFSLLAFSIYLIIKHGNEIKKKINVIKLSLIQTGTYFFGTFIFVLIFQSSFLKISLLTSITKFMTVFRMPFSFLRYQEVGITTIWPNVLTTVAELNPASIGKVAAALGGAILFLLALIGIVFLMVKNTKQDKNQKIIIGASIVWYLILMGIQSSITNIYLFLFMIALPVALAGITNLLKITDFDIKYSLMMVIFFTGTFLAATKGIRFIALFIPIAAILLGVSSGKIYDFVSNWLAKSLDLNKTLVRVVIIIVLLWLILPAPIKLGWNQAISEVPSYNDAWADTLTLINQSSPDAIITSWWDFGHWFVAGSERRVTFDGGDQDSRVYWVGKTLLTSSEKESTDVLRMLNCGQTNARYRLEKIFNDDYKAINVLNNIISVNKTQATKILMNNNLSKQDVNYVINNTHCENIIDQYYIVSKDMIGKAGVWAHFGSWDFDRAYLFNNVNKMNTQDGIEFVKSKLNLSETEARKITTEIQTTKGDQWISPWPSFKSKVGACSLFNKTKIRCETGLIYDLTKDQAFLATQKGIVKPKAISYMLNGEYKYKEYSGNTMDIGAALFPTKGGYGSIVMSPELTNSMFTRMYFFNGAGLKRFKQLSHKTAIDGEEIYLYKVNLNETQ